MYSNENTSVYTATVGGVVFFYIEVRVLVLSIVYEERYGEL